MKTVNSGTIKIFASGEITEISPKTAATNGRVMMETNVEIKKLVINVNKNLPTNLSFKKCSLNPPNSSFIMRIAKVAVKESQSDILKTEFGETRSIIVTEMNRAVYASFILPSRKAEYDIIAIIPARQTGSEKPVNPM